MQKTRPRWKALLMIECGKCNELEVTVKTNQKKGAGLITVAADYSHEDEGAFRTDLEQLLKGHCFVTLNNNKTIFIEITIAHFLS